MKKKYLQSLMGILIIGALALSGCSGKESAAGGRGAGREAGEIPRMDENAVFGEIEEIGEDTITVALAQMPERPEGEEPPEDMPEMEEGAEPPEDLPEMEEGAEPPEDLPQNPPEGEGQMELTLTGETQEISVTDSTTYEINGEEGALEDLSVEDVVTVSLDDDGNAESVRVGMGQMGGRGAGRPGQEETQADNGEEETQNESGEEDASA